MLDIMNNAKALTSISLPKPFLVRHFKRWWDLQTMPQPDWMQIEVTTRCNAFCRYDRLDIVSPSFYCGIGFVAAILMLATDVESCSASSSMASKPTDRSFAAG